MPAYVEYQLDGNTTILIETDEGVISGPMKASRELGDVAKVKAKISFMDALKDIRAQAKLLLRKCLKSHELANRRTINRIIAA